MFEVLSPKHGVPSSEFRVPSAECRVPSAECQVPSAEAWNLIFNNTQTRKLVYHDYSDNFCI
jgi:hypothetical protein